MLRGTEIKPVLHIIDWREDGVATVRWCGGKYLFDAITLEAGETKTCPMCAIELHHDRKKKEVVEGGFPKVPNRTGGGMKVRETLEELLNQDVYHCDSYDDDARLLAPKIARGFRATAEEMAELLTRVGVEKELVDRCVTAGVAAMMEQKGEG